MIQTSHLHVLERNIVHNTATFCLLCCYLYICMFIFVCDIYICRKLLISNYKLL